MNTLFPVGLIVKQSNIDLEMMRHYSRQWGVEREQMGSGVFSTSMSVVHTPNIQLAFTFYSDGVMRKGNFPLGSVLVGFVVGNPSSVFQNKKLLKNELIILEDNDELDILSYIESGVYILAIEKNLFHNAFQNYFNVELKDTLKHKRFKISQENISHFTNGLDTWINYLQKNGGGTI